ncbi:uncharacterized protein A1O9_06526 [Exophiala aquamarina CBS 119918]|uniref:Uncharacterized protein n=1 Tax=Exophiala aquamarina CBS 119918 TaxID=1182545 RepID=A0A072PSV1_9EURO|nr:uncharacterized protein A1O9_06526 [Exophiala aquamarina CBS 119918]KEF58600.1 hypothetical protein A1O9_06526 [Exophiala aquamarina CBS 119918]
MSADLFAAFVTSDGEGYSAEPNVTGQSQNVLSKSWDNELHPTTGLDHAPVVQSKKALISPLWQKDSRGTDVLFDADAAEDDDDFGDFEDVDAADAPGQAPKPLVEGDQSNITRPINPAQNTPDLITLEPGDGAPATDPGASEVRKQQESQISLSPTCDLPEPQAPWDGDWGDFEETSPAGKPPAHSGESRLSNQPAKMDSEPAEEVDEEWEPFEDGQPQQSRSDTTNQTQAPATSMRAGRNAILASNEAAERPTNVPPPSMLLQLLSSVFEAVHGLNNSGEESKQVLGSRILLVFRVVSRIIAGRSLRWKRDTILAQSMRIGQAGSSRGMKLASVNRGESAREEREVEDLIGHWSRYAHEFNSILAQAHMTGHRLKLSSSLSLKIVKSAGSGKQCALCGLQRNERINGIDTDTEDLFGEFWTEHWGHKDCCEFWYLYKKLLGQR